MFQQVTDFGDECAALDELLAPLADDDFGRQTQFKSWTVNDVVGHLHVWNGAAELTLRDPDGFRAFLGEVMNAVVAGALRQFERDRLDGAKGRALLDAWRERWLGMVETFGAADPKARVQWAGPDMSVRSCISARMMETWAHGQELFDLLGAERAEADRIGNIVLLGVKTFRWTFQNRSLPLPETPPYVRLRAPSGALWEHNEPSEDNRIEGSAVDFCRVVTQVRNVADTSLVVRGEVAERWMSIAQCFAGPAEDPPAPGTRFKVEPA